MPVPYRFSSLVYELVSIIESGYGEAALEYLNWSDPKFTNSLCSFSRISVLRHVAFSWCHEEWFRDMRKNPEVWIDGSERLNTLYSDFRFYGIKIQKFTAYCRLRKIPFDDEADALHEWARDNEAAFYELFLNYTKEVEHLLFANRHYLLRFHLALAEFIKSYDELPHSFRVPIRRVAIPKWVKRAAYFRDRGRCVFCNVDLSGIVDLDKEEHFDHMVSLASGGTNDPTNIQLSCRKCNLKKGAKSKTKYLYSEWWPDA